MIAFSGDWKRQQDLDRFLDKLREGWLCVLHPDFHAELRQYGVQFDRVKESELVEYGKMYALNDRLFQLEPLDERDR